jgi:hypothetical protein
MLSKLKIQVLFTALFVVTLLGCGGGGGGGGGGAIVAGRESSVEAAKAVYNGSLSLGLSNNAGFSSSESPFLRFARQAANGELHQNRGDWEYDYEFELYYRVTIDTETRFRVEFTDNPSNAANRGFLDLRLLNGQPYPVTVQMDIGITAGPFQFSGRLTFVFLDPDLDQYSVSANFQSNRPRQRLVANISENFGTVTGSMTASDSNVSVTIKNIVSLPSGQFDAILSASGGVTGLIHESPDGSGYVTIFHPSTGTWRIDWDANLYCTLTDPNNVQTGLGYAYDLQ